MNLQNRILFVDDEYDNRFSFQALFRREYKILLADSAEEARRLVELFPFDLVISDQRMPGESGLDFFQWLKDYKPELIRILVTGSIPNEMKINALEQGLVHSWISKPWGKTDLHHAIEELLAERE